MQCRDLKKAILEDKEIGHWPMLLPPATPIGQRRCFLGKAQLYR